jgi:hypothetical protein
MIGLSSDIKYLWRESKKAKAFCIVMFRKVMTKIASMGIFGEFTCGTACVKKEVRKESLNAKMI